MTPTPPGVPLSVLRDLHKAARFRSRIWDALLGLAATTTAYGAFTGTWTTVAAGLALTLSVLAMIVIKVEPYEERAWARLDERTYNDGLRAGRHLSAIQSRGQ